VIVKITESQLAAVGAKNESEFSAKFDSFVAASKQLETAMQNAPDLSALEKRIAALESNPSLTEARVSELFGAKISTSVSEFVSGEAGKKLIYAEASKAIVETAAATGTLPVKDSPVPAVKTDAAADLVKAGKFEEAYAASAELQAEFPDAKCYAAYAKAEAAGRVKFSKTPSTNK
jgi:hypothetical protein